MLELQCDNDGCTERFTKYECQIGDRPFQFHSRTCAKASLKKGGKLDAVIKKTNQERYGFEHPFQSPVVQTKAKEMWMKTLGVDHPLKSPEVKAKRKQTNLKRHGVEEPLSLPDVIEKRYKTNEERYGDAIASRTSTVKAKISKANKANAPQAKKKREGTNLAKYGVSNTFQLPQPRENAISLEARQKAHETLKETGFYSRKETKQENQCYEALCELFGAGNVSRHEEVNGWDIDIYVKHLNTYVQVDGVYWHGLDRQLDVIAEHKHPRDVTIESTVHRDAVQNNWFATSNLHLIRVTDTQVKQWRNEGVLHERLKTLLA